MFLLGFENLYFLYILIRGIIKGLSKSEDKQEAS